MTGAPGRVLVTGATGVFGRAATRWLTRAGVEVVGLARSAGGPAPPGVRWHQGDVRDQATVTAAMDGCDAVVHLAWVVVPLRSADEIHDINIGGSEAVLAAMRATGCDHLVFSSSLTAYGSDPDHADPYREDEPLRAAAEFHYGADKCRAETLLRDGCTEASSTLTIFRAATVLGRGVANTVANVFAGPAVMGVAGADLRWQFLHPDDLGRFVTTAVAGRRDDIVNLAAPDILTLAEVGAILGKRVVEVSPAVLDRAAGPLWRMGLVEIDPGSAASMTAMPTVDTSRLRDEWGFECAWSSAATLTDARPTLERFVQLGSASIRRPARLPLADADRPRDYASSSGAALIHAAPEGVRGSFDTPMDPGYPTWTATNLSEAFPGPLTPLSLDLATATLRAGTDSIVALLGLTGETAHEATVRMVGAFAHHMYVNVDVARAAVADVPGMSRQDVDAQYLGTAASPGPKRPTAREIRAAPGLVRRVVPALAGWRREVRKLCARTHEAVADDDAIRGMSDAALASHLDLLRDLMAEGWGAAIVGNFATGLVSSSAETVETIGGTPLPSAAALTAVEQLVDEARSDADVMHALADSAGLDDMRTRVPAFAARFDRLLDAHGHRGPGEMELANPTFGDRPDLLLRIVARAASAPRQRRARPAPASRPRMARRLEIGAAATREAARDAVVEVQHGIRRATRERGRRLVVGGAFDDPTDVLFLTWAEMHAGGAEAASVVADRRREHDRFQTIRMPVHFTRTWVTEQTAADPSPGGAGSVLSGIAGSAGRATGPARVLRDATDPLEPGDVMVVRVTDTGWTPLFALASAVVTDVGGTLSHAAIVAREFGIPCVLGTEHATAALGGGQIVTVDGAAGSVTVH